MFQWRIGFRRLRQLNRRESRRRRPARTTLSGIEHLESRTLLTSGVLAHFEAHSGALTIEADTDSAPITVTVQHQHVLINGLSPDSGTLAADDVTSLTVRGGAGDNRIDLTGVTRNIFPSLAHVEVDGGGGADTIVGSGLDDLIRGGDGQDWIDGGSGADTIFGGAGQDTLLGGAGHDILWWGAADEQADDVIIGGDGWDKVRIDTGSDDDRIDIETHHQRLHVTHSIAEMGSTQAVWAEQVEQLSIGTGLGNDTVQVHDLTGLAEFQSIRLHLGRGDDVLLAAGQLNPSVGIMALGRDGNDLLIGGRGGDQLHGESGRDVLIGGRGADELFGGEAGDVLIGGTTDFDADEAALQSMLSLWTGEIDYAARVAMLEDQASAVSLQSTVTVHDDSEIDTLTGGDGYDWFFLTGEAQDHHHHSHEVAGNQDHTSAGDPGAESPSHHGTTGEQDDIIVPMIVGVHPDFLHDHITDNSADETVHSRLPHADNAVMRANHLAMYRLVALDEVTHTAVASGNWSQSSTWADGIVPGAGARVLIPRDTTVTVDGQFHDAVKTIRIAGTLRFDPYLDTLLKADTIVSEPGSVFEMGTASTPIHARVTARLVIADLGAIDRAWDPFALSRGLILHGTTRIHGAATTSYVPLAAAARAGDTVLVLSETPRNWNVGDRLVLAGTDGNGQQDEELEILLIKRNRIVVRPLEYDHVPPHLHLEAHVANLTRNTVIESENAAPDHRGHTMFMHSKHVEVHHAAFYNLGRTDKSIPANDPAVDETGNLVYGTGSNPRARYPVHFHRTGTVDDGRPAIVHGSVVSGSPGWGFVNHSSYVEMTENVGYDIAGAAFVTEAGDEIGSFRRNFAVHTIGTGMDRTGRVEAQDFGHQGDGFWFQGPGVAATDNISAGANGHGYNFYTFGLHQDGLGHTKFLSANLVNPNVGSNAATIEVSDVPLVEFRNNVSYATYNGTKIRYHLWHAEHGQRSVMEELIIAGAEKSGLAIPFTDGIVVRNVDVVGDVDRPFDYQHGIRRNNVTRNVLYENVRVEGYTFGLRAPRQGENVIDGGYFNSVQGIDIPSALREGRSILITGDVRFGALASDVLNGHTQYDIAMNFDPYPQMMSDSIDHLFYADEVILDFGPFQRQRLYFEEQAADFVPFPKVDWYVPYEYIGKTNQQLWDEFGLAIGGEIAPADAIRVPGIKGLVAPAG